MFSHAVQKADYYLSPSNITLKDFQFTNFNVSNQTVDLAFKFDEPFELGLITEESDHIVFFFNESYPFSELLESSARMLQDQDLQKAARARVELTFDKENPQ